jgi:WXXGXW repeat (2 copies)
MIEVRTKMRRSSRALSLGVVALGLAAFLSVSVMSACAQTPPRPPERFEPFASEPPPPPPPNAAPTAQPHPKAEWVDGHWRWVFRRYVWIPGHWAFPPENQHWVPGHWARHELGWYWVPGYWE